MGELFALLSAICFSAANVTITRGASRGARDNGAFLSILMTATLAAAAMFLFPPSAGHVSPTPRGLLWYVAAGVLTIFVGRVFLFASVQHLGAVRASAIKRLNPVFSVLFGVALLGEPIGGAMGVGMLLVFASFGLLAVHSWRQRPQQDRAAQEVGQDGALASLANLGYVYGPVSALAYATGYLARKQGLLVMPDPNMGTFIGAIAGAVAFLVAAFFVRSYRAAIGSTFEAFNPWLVTAGVMSSLGQLFGFVALSFSTISRVALITSMEVIFTILLSVWLLRRRERLDSITVLAALMSLGGTALIIAR